MVFMLPTSLHDVLPTSSPTSFPTGIYILPMVYLLPTSLPLWLLEVFGSYFDQPKKKLTA